jgi:tetratricopeptide (TPR) repeat protein
MASRALLSVMMVVLVFAGMLAGSGNPGVAQNRGTEEAESALPWELGLYAGSRSCIECHEKFYKLWSTSRHGLAMQPYSAEFAARELTPQTEEVAIGKYRYRADIGSAAGWVVETGSQGKVKKYPMVHVLGGKNVYYFLTPLERGRLQTLPVAYDVRTKKWYDTAASGVRHFAPGERSEPVSWKNWPYTFNTACFSCHVSQLSTNFNLKADTYKTTWAEPGINCETCHGPSKEHNEVMRATPKGQLPPDLKIISVKKFTNDQHNAACGSCHAKMSPLTTTFKPGDRFFDHFDIATLDDRDYYPDGRDLGENYTYTSWLMSPCVKSGQLNCIKCHTSSGRYRFGAEEKANEACLPCHAERVQNAAAHTRHKAEGPGNRCVSCHMPMTAFARMNRSDHSMLPPTPAATIAHGSPNACNICHADKDAAWADRHVREWRERDYQAPVLYRAGLIEAARKRDWKRLPEMLDYITGPHRDEVFAASLIRLTMTVEDERVLTTLLKAVKDPSPLVRAAAADSLSFRLTRESYKALMEATGDSYRLVRVRAAASLAHFPVPLIKEADEGKLKKATAEYLASLTARPDQWDSHYNLGNYYLNRGDYREALASYDTALRLEPQAVLAMVNASIAYARMGENDKAETSLQRALEVAPQSGAANFNMGLLKAEQNQPKEAERYLRAAFQADPQMAAAAYNLCVLTAKDRMDEAVTWCRKAAELRPREPKYAYTLAFYQRQNGDTKGAITTLQSLVKQRPGYAEAYFLLAEIHMQQGERQKAVAVYRQALEGKDLSPRDQYRIEAALRQLGQ